MSCPETRTVEALYDGRLPPERAESLRLHLVTCAACAQEASRLELLSSALATLPEPDVSPGRIAAGRSRLLDSAERGGEKASVSVGRTASFALAACAAVTVFSFGLQRVAVHSHDRAAGVRAAAPPANELALTVTPAAGTTWSRSSSDTAETLKLVDGELDVRVTRHAGGRRLLVLLPDGELEDVGTVFSVEAHDGSTRSVSVSDGRVALRLRGRSELLLSAGERFSAPNDNAAASSSASAPSTNETAANAARPPGSARGGSRPAPATEEAPVCPSAALFQDGAQAFKRGEYATAASLLDRFSAACGGGGHGEDAAYLRMVALARDGRRAEARAQAESYLSHFPNGFRRKEAEKLIQSQ